MNEKLQLQLVQEFPNLYKNFRGDPAKTCMAFGIETNGNGWFNLIYDLSAKLEKMGVVAAQVK